MNVPIVDGAAILLGVLQWVVDLILLAHSRVRRFTFEGFLWSMVIMIQVERIGVGVVLHSGAHGIRIRM